MATTDITSVTRVGYYGGPDPLKPVFQDVIGFTGPVEYNTGGMPTAPILLATGMVNKTIVALVFLKSSDPNYMIDWDRVNSKLIVVQRTDGTEVADETDLHLITFEMLAYTV